MQIIQVRTLTFISGRATNRCRTPCPEVFGNLHLLWAHRFPPRNLCNHIELITYWQQASIPTKILGCCICCNEYYWSDWNILMCQNVYLTTMQHILIWLICLWRDFSILYLKLKLKLEQRLYRQRKKERQIISTSIVTSPAFKSKAFEGKALQWVSLSAT